MPGFAGISDGSLPVFSFTTKQKVGRTIPLSIKSSEVCHIRIDCGDGVVEDLINSRFPAVTVKGTTLRIYCDTPEQITGINLSFCKVTGGDFAGATGCKDLSLFVNDLSADSTQALIASLPQVSEGSLTVKQLNNSLDHNEVYKSHVRKAQNKGWKVFAFSGHISQRSPYAGEDDPELPPAPRPATKAATMRSAGDMLLLKVTGSGAMTYRLDNDTEQPLNQGSNFISGVRNREVTLTGDIISLVCFQSDLTALEICDAPNLVYLNCCANLLEATAMQRLIESLPRNNNTEKKLIAYDSQNEYERNVLSNALIADAIAKNWQVLDWCSGEPAPISPRVPAIKLSTQKQKGDLVEINLKGAELQIDLGDGSVIPVNEERSPLYELKGDYIHIYGKVTDAGLVNTGATMINLSTAKDLKWLDCSKNYLDDTAFDQLIQTLPIRSPKERGKIIVRNQYDPAERNRVSKTNVADLKTKNWDCLEDRGEGILAPCDGEFIPPHEPIAAKIKSSLPIGGRVTIFAEGITPLWIDPGDQALIRLTSQTGYHTFTVKGSEWTLYGDFTWLAMSETGLNSFVLHTAPHLMSLYLNKNDLTELEVDKAPVLEFLNCADNDLRGDAITQLMMSLRDASTGDKRAQLYLVDFASNTPHENSATPEQVRLATDKGWDVRDFNGGDLEEKPLYTHLANAPKDLQDLIILYQDGCIEICYATPEAEVSVFTEEGILLQQGHVDADGRCSIPAVGSSENVRIVQIGHHTPQLILPL